MSEKRNPRILLVEDEPGDARLMQLAMSKCIQADLHQARDGLEALRFLWRQGKQFADAPRPDLILLDIKMPGQGGLEFLQVVKQDEDLRAIPVVAITTSTLESDVAEAYRLGAAGYMLKQADFDEFTAAVRDLCQYWFGRMRLPRNQK